MEVARGSVAGLVVLPVPLRLYYVGLARQGLGAGSNKIVSTNDSWERGWRSGWRSGIYPASAACRKPSPPIESLSGVSVARDSNLMRLFSSVTNSRRVKVLLSLPPRPLQSFDLVLACGALLLLYARL